VPHDTVIVAGQDLAKLQDFSTIVELTVKDNKARLTAIKQWPHTDYSVVMRQTKELYEKRHWRVLGVDETSMGEPLVESYKTMGLNVEGIKFTLITKDEMIKYTRSLLQNKMLSIGTRGADELRAQIKEQEMIITVSAGNDPDNRRYRYGHPQGRHDDQFWALCIACYTARPWLTDIPIFQIRVK